MAAFTPIGVDAQTRGLSGFLRNLGKMDKSIQKTGKSTESVGKQFTGLGSKVLGVGAKMAKVAAGGVVLLGTAVAGLGVTSIKTAISFESAFAGVIKTTDGLVDSAGELTAVGEEVRQGFRDLAKEVPVAVEELLGIGEIAGQLGVGKEALIDFTRTVADLGVATNLTTEEAAFNLARIANIFGIETEDMGENSQRLGSTIVELGNNFATTERDIATFAERMAGAGKIAGLTQPDILAIGTAMSSVGIQAEAGGTAVQKVLLAMNEAVVGTTTGFVDNSEAIGKNQDKLLDLNAQLVKLEAQTGIAGDELWNQFEAFKAAGGAVADFGRELGDTRRAQLFKTIRAIQDLSTETDLLRENQGKPITAEGLETFARTAGLTAAEFKELWQEDASKAFELFVLGLGEQGDAAVGTLEELGLTDQRLVRSFLSLAGAGDLITETLARADEAWQENTALTEEAEKRYRTTESQLLLLKNQLRDVAITIGDDLLPFLNELVKAARPLIEELGKRLPAAIEAVIAKVKELIGAFQAGGVAGLAGALGFSDETIATMQSIGNQIAEAIQFVIEHWEAFKGALIGIGAVLAAAGIAAAIVGIATAIGSLLSPIGLLVIAAGLLGAAWSTNFLGIRDTLTAFWENTGRLIFEQLVVWLEINIPAAIQTLSDFWTNTLLPALTDVWAFIQESVIPILSDIWDWLEINIPAAIQTLSDFWTNTLLPALREVWSFISEDLVPLFEAIIDLLEVSIELAIQTAANAWENILLPALRTVRNFIDENIIPIFNDVKEAIQPVIDFIADLISKLNLLQGLDLGAIVPEVDIGKGFEGAKQAIGDTTSKITGFTEALRKVEPPTFLKTDSPTPFEIGLLGIANTMTGPLATGLQVFSSASITVFTQVDLLVKQLDATLTLIWEVTLPQLQVVTQETANIMVTGFNQVSAAVNQLNSLLSQTVSLLQSIASAATRAAKAMTEGFEEAAESIDDKLIEALEELRDILEDVKTEAEAAAAAVNDIGRGTPTAGPGVGPGFQRGANFTVPPGFPRDSFRMGVTTGERVIVIPPGEPTPTGVGGAGNEFNLTVQTVAAPSAIIQQFEVMQALVS